MLNDAIYHNPRCSKSRQTLALLQDKGVKLPVVEYLDQPPSADELLKICALLDKRPLEITRTKEALFKELGLSKSDDRSDAEWAEVLAANPKLIERPIVVHGGKAALGRPPEDVLAIL